MNVDTNDKSTLQPAFFDEAAVIESKTAIIPDSDSATISNLGQNALEQQRTEVVAHEQKSTQLEVLEENNTKEKIDHKSAQDDGQVELEENELSLSKKDIETLTEVPDTEVPNTAPTTLFGRIKEGFKATANTVLYVIKLIVSAVKWIIVTPFKFVASLFIKVGEGIVKAGKGIINFAGAILKSAAKCVASTAKFFASALKNPVVFISVGFIAVVISFSFASHHLMAALDLKNVR